jgi:two-component system, OmpR family, response regulator
MPAEPTDGQARILVVDDEENIRFLLDSALTHFGFTVRSATSGSEGVEIAREMAPDLVVLDVMLPDMDGLEVLKQLRRDGIDASVLFLTAKSTTRDLVHGFTAGGDDYVAKPFSLEELLARIRGLLRRSGRLMGPVHVCGDVELDERAHRVTRGGIEIDLSPTEFKLLRFLMLHKDQVVTRAQILDHVWAYDFGGDSNVVETYISYLRRKVDRLGVPLIKTVRGVGYAIRTEP